VLADVECVFVFLVSYFCNKVIVTFMVGLTDCVRDKMQSRNKGFARSTVLSTDSKSTRTAVESTRTLAHDQGEREVLCRTQEIDD